MKYRAFIEDYFMIDAAKTGQLVPFKFNTVQEDFYENVLCKEYDIENKGLDVPVREHIVKARREGFSSLIMSLFAADDLLQENPTMTDIYTYRDKDTATFRKRYRHFILTYFAQKFGVTQQQIYDDINILEQIANEVLSVDSTSLELKHNHAHAQFSTAGSKVAGRGGVRHKLLFSELAFYPNTVNMSVSQMVEPTMRQVDIEGGWIFMESTEDGPGTYQYQLWKNAEKGRSRFRNRFYGCGFFYNEEELAKIKSEFVDLDQFRKEYPRSVDDLFKGGSKSFTSEGAMEKLIDLDAPDKEVIFFTEFRHQNGIDVMESLESELRRLEQAYAGYAIYVGIDEAKDVDATVALALKDNKRALKGGVKCITIDTTRGDWMADWFERNTSWYIKRVKFSRPNKSLMFSNLQIVIKSKQTQIPLCKLPAPKELPLGETHVDEWVSDEHKHFWEQMLNLEKEIIGNLLVVHHPDGACAKDGHNYDECMHHDDYPDAWMMAEDAYFEINGAPKMVKPEKVETVTNRVDVLLNRGTLRDASRSRYGGSTSYE